MDRSHYITQADAILGRRLYGPGGGAALFSRLGSVMLDTNSSRLALPDALGLKLLDEGFDAISLDPIMVTKWAGKIGASYVLASMAYNTWAARGASPLAVMSTGGILRRAISLALL